MYSKLINIGLAILAGLALVGFANAGYAVSYASNAWGFSVTDSTVSIDLTTHTSSYTNYPNYYTTSDYYYNSYPTYSYPAYSYPTYYTYVQPVVYYPTYPVAYTYSYPVYYNSYYIAPTYYPTTYWYYG